MPTYEYECTKCGHTFEAFQSMKDEPLSSCPKCRGRVRRLIQRRHRRHLQGQRLLHHRLQEGLGAHRRQRQGQGKDGGAEKTAEKAGEKTPAKTADSGTGSAKTEKTPVS